MRSPGSDFLVSAGRLARNLDELAVALLLLGLLARLLAGGLLALGFLGLDDVDAHLVEHREDVLDLVGGDFLGRKHRVDLLVGDVAALLRGLDHLADGGVRKIEQRQRRIGVLGGILLRGSSSFFSLTATLALARHSIALQRALPALMRTADGCGPAPRPDSATARIVAPKCRRDHFKSRLTLFRRALTPIVLPNV